MQGKEIRELAENRITILHFTNSTVWGGVEKHICSLLANLSPAVFRPCLVCDPLLYGRFRDRLPVDMAIMPLALSSPKHYVSALRFARLLRRKQPQIVHSHMFWSSLFASPIACVCRVPAIVETLHGTEAWRRGWKAKFFLDRATARLVSRYIAVCDSDAQFLQAKKHVSVAKISMIHNGVDVGRFIRPRDARRALRRSLGLLETELVLIVVARFHSGKGHRVLFDAMCRLLRFYPNVKLICLGEGEQEPELRALCKERGLCDCVRFEGYRENVAEWLAAVDINVLPTFYEGFPLTVLEAMASGVPTVASNVGGIPEAIRHGIDGLLVPPGEPQILADALAQLLGNATMRAEMGRAAQKRLRENFAVEQQIHSTERMYLNLCGGRITQEPRPSDTRTEPAYDTTPF